MLSDRLRPNANNLRKTKGTIDIRILFVPAVYPDVGVLFVVSLSFHNKLQFHHEEHEEHESDALKMIRHCMYL
jgi:hypothetical protein